MSASDQKKRSKSGQKAAIPAADSRDKFQVDDPASPLASVTQPTHLDHASIQHFSSLLQELKMREMKNELKTEFVQKQMEMQSKMELKCEFECDIETLSNTLTGELDATHRSATDNFRSLQSRVGTLDK